jgi:hypothetical protein
MSKKSTSERFGKVRKQNEPSSEEFGNFPNVSERTADHVLTVREVAKMFENAGVPRTERSIINWCQRNRHGVPRLDNFFDINERKYFITPNSVDRVIAEEKNKLHIQGQNVSSESPASPSESFRGPSEDFGSNQKNFGSVPNDSAEFRNPASDGIIKNLEAEILDLKIANRGKDMFIEQLKEMYNETYKDFTTASHRIGELEATLRLEGPKNAAAEKSEETSEPENIEHPNSEPNKPASGQPEEHEENGNFQSNRISIPVSQSPEPEHDVEPEVVEVDQFRNEESGEQREETTEKDLSQAID